MGAGFLQLLLEIRVINGREGGKEGGCLGACEWGYERWAILLQDAAKASGVGGEIELSFGLGCDFLGEGPDVAALIIFGDGDDGDAAFGEVGEEELAGGVEGALGEDRGLEGGEDGIGEEFGEDDEVVGAVGGALAGEAVGDELVPIQVVIRGAVHQVLESAMCGIEVFCAGDAGLSSGGEPGPAASVDFLESGGDVFIRGGKDGPRGTIIGGGDDGNDVDGIIFHIIKAREDEFGAALGLAVGAGGVPGGAEGETGLGFKDGSHGLAGLLDFDEEGFFVVVDLEDPIFDDFICGGGVIGELAGVEGEGSKRATFFKVSDGEVLMPFIRDDADFGRGDEEIGLHVAAAAAGIDGDLRRFGAAGDFSADDSGGFSGFGDFEGGEDVGIGRHPGGVDVEKIGGEGGGDAGLDGIAIAVGLGEEIGVDVGKGEIAAEGVAGSKFPEGEGEAVGCEPEVGGFGEGADAIPLHGGIGGEAVKAEDFGGEGEHLEADDEGADDDEAGEEAEEAAEDAIHEREALIFLGMAKSAASRQMRKRMPKRRRKVRPRAHSGFHPAMNESSGSKRQPARMEAKVAVMKTSMAEKSP